MTDEPNEFPWWRNEILCPCCGQSDSYVYDELMTNVFIPDNVTYYGGLDDTVVEQIWALREGLA